MIKIKSSKVKKLLGGGAIVGTIAAVASKTGKDKLSLSNPMDKDSCPTGNCGTSGAINKFAKSKILGNSVGDLWKQLVCGEDTTGGPTSNFEAQRMSNLWLRSTGCNATQLLNLLKIQDGKVKIDKDLVKGRLKNISKNMISDTKQASLISSISLLTGKSNEESAVVVNGVQTIVKKKNIKDVNDFVNLMGSVTGNKELLEVLDLQAEGVILGDLLKQASDLGLLDAADIILSKIKDDKMRRSVLLDNILSYATWSDLDMIDKTIDHVGSDKILAKHPNIVELIVKHFNFKQTSDKVLLEQTRVKFTRVLNRLDSKWHVTKRNGVETSSLNVFIGASKSSLTLFNLDERYSTEANICGKYMAMDIIRVARQNVKQISIY